MDFLQWFMDTNGWLGINWDRAVGVCVIYLAAMTLIVGCFHAARGDDED